MIETKSFVLSLPICLVSFVGCGHKDGRVPVEGVVTLDGQPLAGAQVSFDQPELGPRENKGYIGWTNAEGRYALRPLMEEGSGIPPGEYRVLLTTAAYDPSGASQSVGPKPKTIFFAESTPTPPERIPPAYRVQKFTVPPEGTDKADFTLKSK